MKSKLLSENGLKSVEAAIHEAEKKTNGEIVVHITQQSDEYAMGKFIAPLILLSSSVMLNLLLVYFYPEINAVFNLYFSVPIALLGFLVAHFSAECRLLFVSTLEVEKRVFEKSQQVFLQRELFKTKDRTGVLILLSELEKEVMVLGDSGINQKIKPEEWEHIVDVIIEGIRNKNTSDGLVKGVSMIGDLLMSADFHIKPDDENELPNTISFD